jgi:hypothetical protein
MAKPSFLRQTVQCDDCTVCLENDGLAIENIRRKIKVLIGRKHKCFFYFKIRIL